MSASRSGKPTANTPATASAAPEPKVETKAMAPKEAKQYVPEMGDVLLFNYRAPSARTAITVPLVVTKVHYDNQTVDGVALNANHTGGPMGAIACHGILPGKGDFEWRTK